MLKQVLKALMVVAVLLAVASPAWAGGINAILDDPTSSLGTSAYSLAPGTSGPYSIPQWDQCSPYPPVPGGPGGEPASGYELCLALINNTESNITNLMLNIPDSNPDTFTCIVSGASTGFGCSVSSAPGMVTLDFVGIPGFQYNTEIYIGVGCAATNAADGCTGTGTQDVTGVGLPTITTPTYDPSTLVLLAVGMAMLAIGGVRRYA